MLTVLVTGSSGMLGTSLQTLIENSQLPSMNFIFLTRKILDLADFDAVQEYDFKSIDIIIHLAAKCGGLYDNMSNNYDFYKTNNEITRSILYLAEKYRIHCLINVLSTCIFPDYNGQDIVLLESKNILNGPPHDSNKGYSYAKRNLYIESKLMAEYKRSFQVVNLIPTNMYGSNDKSTHVIPDLIKKCRNATDNETSFTIKGSGKAIRQFLYVGDFSRIILLIIFKSFRKPVTDIIVSPSESYSIKELAELIAQKLEYKDKIIYDTSFSDGQLIKKSNHFEIQSVLPNFEFTSLDHGLDLIIAEPERPDADVLDEPEITPSREPEIKPIEEPVEEPESIPIEEPESAPFDIDIDVPQIIQHLKKLIEIVKVIKKFIKNKKLFK